MTAQQEPSSSPDPPRHPRRRAALRVVMGVLLAVGMIYGWSAMGWQKARKQAEAIRAIVAVGGQVYCDYQWRDGQLQTDGQPPEAAWLRRLVGAEFFDRAVAVDLRDVDRPGDTVGWLLLMPYLVDLNAGGTRLDDSALETVRRLAGLTHLDLSGTTVSDRGVAGLSHLSKLRRLSLAATRITDAGVEKLSTLRQLRQLDLAGTPVSDVAVQRLRESLPQCRITSP